jgi:hypothetical protein
VTARRQDADTIRSARGMVPRPPAPVGFRAVATVIAWSDRRARLALILAMLCVPSLAVTAPAAIWLGVGAVRGHRLSSGAEPALGFLAIALAAFGALTVNSVLLRTFDRLDPIQAMTGLAWAVALAAAVAVCTSLSLRIHPERRGALLVARAGLVGAIAGGAALLVQLLAAID